MKISSLVFIILISAQLSLYSLSIFIENNALIDSKDDIDKNVEKIIREHVYIGNNVYIFSSNNKLQKNKIKKVFHNIKFINDIQMNLLIISSSKNSIFYVNNNDIIEKLKKKDIKYIRVVTENDSLKNSELLKLSDENGSKLLLSYKIIENIRIPINKDNIRVSDGDSIYYKNISYRLLGFDAPEVDQEYGVIAKNYLDKLIKNSDKICISPAEKDIYNRVLCHVYIDDVPIAYYIMISRMGIQTITSYGDNGFPAIAENILFLSRTQGRLPFISPKKFRAGEKKGEKIKTKAKSKKVHLLYKDDIIFNHTKNGLIGSITTNK